MNFLNLFSGINLKEIIQMLPDAVIVTNCDGRILWTNRAAENMFNMDHSEEVDLYIEDFINEGLALINKSAEEHTSVIAGAITADGTEFFIELNSTLNEDQHLVTVRDVTAMTKVLANAEKTGRLNKDKNLMLTKLTHEFKSPLQSIIGFSNALSDGLGGEISEKQNKYVKIINKNASELLAFMDKFFEFSKAESTLVKFDIKTFNVVNSVQEVLKVNELLFNAKKLSVNLDFEDLQNHPITTDESALKTILQNVLENSVKLTEIGSINIKLSNPDVETLRKAGFGIVDENKTASYILITIKDTGIGLQEIELDGLFEPYSQLDKANKKNFARSISLGTAKLLANKLNGEIWAESEIMKGTALNIILPIEKGIVLEDE